MGATYWGLRLRSDGGQPVIIARPVNDRAMRDPDKDEPRAEHEYVYANKKTHSTGVAIMKRFVQRTFVCAVAVTLGLAVSCASPPRAPKAVKTIVFITNSTSDFWKIARKGCEKADAELPEVTVAFKTTNTGTTEEQNGLIRQALDRDEADAIAISPVDPGTQKKVINDAAKRALVMTQDSDAPDTD